MSYFLGAELEQSRDGVYSLHQARFVESILLKFGMENCKPVDSPADTGTHSSSEMCASVCHEQPAMASAPYLSVAGSLMYLTVATGPGTAFAVKGVSHHHLRGLLIGASLLLAGVLIGCLALMYTLLRQQTWASQFLMCLWRKVLWDSR